jgi:anti-anti-sigma factor
MPAGHRLDFSARQLATVISSLVNTRFTVLQYTPAMSSKEFTFELLPDAAPNEHVYRLSGPLLLNNMFGFQSVMRSESAATILDMTDVPYIDSAGLGVLTNSFVAHQKHGRRLLFVSVNERVHELFKLTCLDKLFEVFPNVESARENLKNSAPSTPDTSQTTAP